VIPIYQSFCRTFIPDNFIAGDFIFGLYVGAQNKLKSTILTKPDTLVATVPCHK